MEKRTKNCTHAHVYTNAEKIPLKNEKRKKNETSHGKIGNRPSAVFLEN